MIRESFVPRGVLVLFYSTIPIVIGLVIASVFRTVAKRGGTVFRGAIFMPQVLSGVVIGVIWTWIYAIDGLAQRVPARHRPRRARPALARRLHLGAARHRHDRRVVGHRACAWCSSSPGSSRSTTACTTRHGSTVRAGSRSSSPSRCRRLRYELGVVLTLTVVGRAEDVRPRLRHDAGRPRNRDPGARPPAVHTGPSSTAASARPAPSRVVLAILVFIVTVVIDRIATRGRRMTSRSERIFAYAFLTLFSIIALYPVVGALLLALHPRDALVSGLSVPWPFHFETFKEAWEIAHLSTYLRSSFIVSTAVVLGTTVLSVLAGYAFGTMRFRGENWLFYLLLSGMILPVEAIVIPLYYDFDAVGLTNTYWALILPQIALQRVLRHLLDARLLPLGAEGDARGRRDRRGRKRAHACSRVALPPGRPAVLTLVLFTFMCSWNEFLLPAGDGDRREPAYGAARPRLLRRAALDRPHRSGRGGGHRVRADHHPLPVFSAVVHPGRWRRAR